MSPTIRIDEDVYAALQAHAQAFVDTPNSVLRRVMGLTPEKGAVEEEVASVEGERPSKRPAAKLTAPRTEPQSRRRRAGCKRAPTRTLLPEVEYELPLLTILASLGGSAPAGVAIEELGRQLEGRFMPSDLEPLASGRIRWQSRAQFVRLRLIEAGDMERTSERGIWAISDRGRRRLKTAGSQ